MPAVNISPIFNGVAQTDGNGRPLAFGKILSYQAGSTTPYPTYTDYTGNIANPLTITLGTDGRLPAEMWLEANRGYKFVVQDANSVQIATLDNIGGVITSIPQIQLLPAGIIVQWSGTIGSIPAGWVLCDGQNGTPNLRDKFIVGAGTTYTVGQTGGTADAVVVNHAHTASSPVTDPGHLHGARFNPERGTFGSEIHGALAGDPGRDTTTAFTGITVNTTVNPTGVSGTNANLPPYYALLYIIKV